MNIGILYLTPEGISSEHQYQLLSDVEPATTAMEVQCALLDLGHTAERIQLNRTSFPTLKRFDWLFNLTENVHGFGLNESQIACELETLQIPFTGAGSKGLSLCGDKIQGKDLFRSLGILTPRYEIYPPGFSSPSHLEFPMIVKPALEDASIGIRADSVVNNQEDLACRILDIHQQFNESALVEEFIDGRDIEISLLGNGDHLQILPPYECIYLDNFKGPHILSFEAKWDANSMAYQNTDAVCPASLNENTWNQIQRICPVIFRAFRCRDYARVDFRLRGDELFALEVNPNPCISEVDSSFTITASAAGFTYPNMIAEILNQSMMNQRR